jgi:DNA-directed RNA polymerase specialized sigma24 family protein
MITATVEVRPWEQGWELHITSDIRDGVTQVRTLDKAAAQVRDYLETVADRDLPDLDIRFEFKIGHAELAARARRHSHEAAELRDLASSEMREAVRCLRQDGLSVTDMAAILGVSRGRVSQLVDA